MIFKIIFQKDKRQNHNTDQFQSRSRLFFIYPEYNDMTGASNFDICLIKTQADRYGIHEDISPHFNSIPCLPDKFELKMVRN